MKVLGAAPTEAHNGQEAPSAVHVFTSGRMNPKERQGRRKKRSRRFGAGDMEDNI